MSTEDCRKEESKITNNAIDDILLCMVSIYLILCLMSVSIPFALLCCYPYLVD